jgi:ribosomal protein S18 acetylase RimI-like enzyme
MTSLEKSAESLTQAFFEDPMVVFLLKDKNKRRAPLNIGMKFLLAMGQFDGTVEISNRKGDFDGKNDIQNVGACVSFAPDHYPVSVLKMIPFIFSFIFTFLRARVPLYAILNGLKLLWVIERLHPVEPHHYVLIIGVRPDAQGQGVGIELMQPMIKSADQTAVNIYLESSNPKNIQFYEKLGFKLLNEIYPLKNGPPMFRMLRAPARKA